MKKLVAALASAALPALALNLTDDAPMAQFRGKDQAMFDATLYGVLDNSKDGAKREWSNLDTQAGGEVKAMRSFKRGDKPCRTVFVANKAQGRTSAANYDFCKNADGKWVLAP